MTLPPKHLDESGQRALKNIQDRLDALKRPSKGTAFLISGGEIIDSKKENPFRVAFYEAPHIQILSHPDEWPFSREVVFRSLINLLLSREKRVVGFWKKLADSAHSQQKFMTQLEFEIINWSQRKVRYEAKNSILRRKTRELIADLSKALSKIRELNYLHSICNQAVNDSLDERYKEVFADSAPSWNLWDDKPLKSDLVISKMVEGCQKTLELKSIYPQWYPKKMESRASNKIFAVRLISRLIRKFCVKSSHALIADIASILLEEVITEEDVRKNLKLEHFS